MLSRPLAALLLAPLALPAFAQAPAPAKRPMTFLDMQHMRQVGAPTPSPDGKWLLYTVSTPDWKEAKRQTDIHVVSLERGVTSARQLTFTKDKNETSPRWSRDGSFLVFASNRDAPSATATQNQLYLMRPDGGEARKITDAKEGVSTFALSKDGKWLAYRSGKSGEEQLYRLPIAGIDTSKPDQITKQATGVGLWQWAPDSRRIYFVTADTTDPDEKLRIEKKFNVSIRNMETPRSSLWSLDLEPGRRRASPATRRSPSASSRLPTTGNGSRSAGPPATATSGTSPSRTSTPIRMCSRWPPDRSSA